MSDVKDSWTTATLIDPSPRGFVLLAVRASRWVLPPALPSHPRRAARRLLLDAAAAISDDDRVVEATVFSALIRPPGGGRDFVGAAYDLVLLVETSTVAAAAQLVESDVWRSRTSAVAAASAEVSEIVATNARRINPVDHTRPGVFLFNYFTAPTIEANLFAWQYTAGWFQSQTGLDNSTVLQPLADVDTPFSLVNHCRWDRLSDVLPALAIAPSFRSFVLRTFAEHGVRPRPLLYRIARR